MFRHLVQSAPDVVMILEADSTVRYVNPSVERVLGYRPEDFVGIDIYRHLLYTEEPRKIFDGVAKELKNPSSTLSPVKLEMRHADGSWRYLEAVGVDLLEDPQVHGVVLYARDATGHRALEDELAYRAFHDPLTGLPNRALFMDRLEQALARAARNKENVAVLFLDLDDFKEINDGLGHDAGDDLLVTVGWRLQSCLRPEDTVARLGGDEFGILLHNAKDAARVAERIVEVLRAPTTLDGDTLFVTASIGIAASSSGQDQDKDLLRAADTTMYRAKENGKARWEVSYPATYSKTLERLELEDDLRRAVERGELEIYYQPEVELGTSRIIGMEALLRWENPQRGLISPEEFIGLAEASGLIVPIGQWVLEEACRQAVRWQEQYPDDPPLVSVNLSARQLKQPALAERIGAVLRETGLNPHGLVLEITESFLMKDARHVSNMLQTLRGLGVKSAIDDFGTGYSSLSSLERFPVDFLKIDRSSVSRLGQDKDNAEMLVSALVAVTRTLGIMAIAEGVETAEQLEELREIECDVGHGYYFWEPLPSHAASDLLASSRKP